MKTKRIIFSILFLLSLSVATISTFAKETEPSSYCWEWVAAANDCLWPPVKDCLCTVLVTN